jgi:hypothetical protein|tara:strand:+ start:1995 stop:2699 length:705 start_codon:yes stop_codon:yes gene_type:complete
VSEEQQAQPPVEAEAPKPVAESADFAAQIEALKAKNAELIAERRKDKENRETLQSQMDELRAAHDQIKTAKLTESGDYKTLWEDVQNTVTELKQQLAAKDAEMNELQQGYSKQQLRASTVSQLSQSGALAPDQLYRLIEDNLRTKDGQPVAVVGGVEVPVGEYLSNLKNPGSGYEHHFAATNRAGMGVAGSARSTALPGQSNPWLKDSWNFTEQMDLLNKDPDKARLLKAEAGK